MKSLGYLGSHRKAIVWLLACGLSLGLASGVWAWGDDVDDYIESLNHPDTQQALGLKSVQRDERAVNKVAVIFEPSVSPNNRDNTLRVIGREFHRRLFLSQHLPVAIVVERNEEGQVVNSLIINVLPTTTIPGAQPAASRRTSC